MSTPADPLPAAPDGEVLEPEPDKARKKREKAAKKAAKKLRG